MKKIFLLLLVFVIVNTQISTASGSEYKYAIEPCFRSADTFTSFGIAKVIDNELKAGIINTKGDIVIPFNDKPLAIRRNGLVMVVGDNDMAAFFSSDGTRLTDYIYDTYKRTNPKAPHETTYHYVTASYDGEPLNGLIPFSRENKFGYIDEKGIEVIPPQFEYAEGFWQNNIARIQADGILSEYGTYTAGKYGFIQYSNDSYPNFKIVYEANSLWYADQFCEFNSKYINIADGVNKVLDVNMQEVNLGGAHYRHMDTENNLSLVSNSTGQTAVLDNITQNLLIPFDYREKRLEIGCIVVDNKLLYASDGNIVYEAPEGTRIGNPFISGQSGYIYGNSTPEFLTIIKNVAQWIDNYGLINSNGEVVFEPVYTNTLFQLSDGVIYAENYKGENIFYDRYGKKIFTLNGDIGYLANINMGLIPVQDNKSGMWGYMHYPFETENTLFFGGTSINYMDLYSYIKNNKTS